METYVCWILNDIGCFISINHWCENVLNVLRYPLNNALLPLQQQLNTQFLQAHITEVTVESNKQVANAVVTQGIINNMNTATQIRQSQTTQQLLQQNQYKPPPTCLGFNCR